MQTFSTSARTYTPPQRTTQQVEAELSKLSQLSDLITPLALTGASNTDALDAQIEVLTWLLSLDEIEAMEEEEGWDGYVMSAALTAFDWLNDEPGAPSEDWAEMCGWTVERRWVN